jgi:hypothetical protein
MKLPSPPASVKLLGFALPIALIVTLVALVGAAGLPQVGPMPDVIAYALELAPRTMYAIAIGGSTALSMRMTGMNLDNDYRCTLIHAAAKGQVGPVLVLAGETFAWLAWAVLWSWVYLHQ